MECPWSRQWLSVLTVFAVLSTCVKTKALQSLSNHRYAEGEKIELYASKVGPYDNLRSHKVGELNADGVCLVRRIDTTAFHSVQLQKGMSKLLEDLVNFWKGIELYGHPTSCALCRMWNSKWHATRDWTQKTSSDSV